MRELSLDETLAVSGSFFVNPLWWVNVCVGIGVLWDAVMNGDAPGADFLTGTASGPTPGNVGGRYPIEALGQEPSMNNMPGGQGSQAIGELLQ